LLQVARRLYRREVIHWELFQSIDALRAPG
jgi:hypothetical protein